MGITESFLLFNPKWNVHRKLWIFIFLKRVENWRKFPTFIIFNKNSAFFLSRISFVEIRIEFCLRLSDVHLFDVDNFIISSHSEYFISEFFFVCVFVSEFTNAQPFVGKKWFNLRALLSLKCTDLNHPANSHCIYIYTFVFSYSAVS